MSQKSYRSALIGLLGCPVDENPTVVTIEAAFRELGIDGRYITMKVLPEDLGDAIRGLKATSFLGTHITIPHKVKVLSYLDKISPGAALMGAVNTVYFRDGQICGENTDGKGFLMSLSQGGVELKGKTAVLLGAGGAARAIGIELACHGVSQLLIVNRSPDRGKELTALINEKTSASARYVPLTPGFVIPAHCDLLVQTTSIGLYPDPGCPDVDFDSLTPETVVCDIIPNPIRTKFLQRAAERGCRTFNGFDMLVNQGSFSFKLWTGKDAPIDAMKAALAKEYEP